MAIPELTRAGIAPFITKETGAVLKKRFTPEEIPQLFSDTGVQRKGSDGVFNICMKWRLDESSAIDGVFVRIILEGNLIAWTKPDTNRDVHNFIWIRNRETTLRETPLFWGGMPYEVSCVLQAGKTDDASPRFEVEHLDNIPGIAAFFDKDRHVLPDTLRAQIFPPEAPINPRTRTYVIGGIFLVLAVGYAAHRIIDKYRAPQTSPGEHLEKALKARNSVSTG